MLYLSSSVLHAVPLNTNILHMYKSTNNIKSLQTAVPKCPEFSIIAAFIFVFLGSDSFVDGHCICPNWEEAEIHWQVVHLDRVIKLIIFIIKIKCGLLLC